MQAREWSNGRGTRIVGVLDIGTSKIACLIAAVDAAPAAGEAGLPRLRIAGVGHQRSHGVKAGVITDLDEAEQAIRATIAQAEGMAGVTLDEVVVAVSCGRLRSHTFAASADVEGGVVSEADIGRVLNGARAFAERDGRTLVHMNRIGYRLDGAPGARDPRGMAARRISADLHAVTADDAPIRNLLLVIERCFVSASRLVAAPFASALAVTSEEERRLGVTVIDIGGGVTTIAVFAEGKFIFTDTVPVGGNHVTFDIARTLQTPLAEAERIKALYASVVSAQSDEHEAFSYPLAGEEEGAMYQTTKARLADVVRPRVDSLFGLVRERLVSGGATALAGDRMVLTGGSSQLVGIGEYVANQTGRPVRIARPQPVSGLPPVLSSPAFSTAVGLFASATEGGDVFAGAGREGPGQASYIGRVGQWLREGF